MQNTYEKILKYLIEHDVELTVGRNRLNHIQVTLRHKNRFHSGRIFREEPETKILGAIEYCMSMLFPSFKDFNTPIKRT